MEQFLGKIQDVLDCEQEVKMDTVLDTIEEWDSLSFVAFIAMAKATFGKTVKPDDVRGAKTVEDLYNLVK